MNGSYDTLEKKWVGLVKEQPCSVCGQPGPSDAHHIDCLLYTSDAADE